MRNSSYSWCPSQAVDFVYRLASD